MVSKVYSLQPKDCITEKGIIYRPFEIDGKEVHKMNMAKILSANAQEGIDEINLFIDNIYKMTGIKLTDIQLKEAIQKRMIKGNV